MFRSTIIKGALILTLANIITRILGFVYRIYMSNTIGAEGMGLYQLINPLYLLVWSITSSGLSTSMSKLTSQEMARGKVGNTQRLLFIAITISVSLSLVISFLVHKYAFYISLYYIKDTRTSMSLKLLSVCFPFMACGSVIRGYFFGIKNTTIPAISQVFEQIIRMAFVYLLSASMIPKGLEYACGAAVIGMAMGEILSFLYVGLMWLAKSKNIKKQKPTINYKTAFTMLFAIALPLTLNRVTSSLFSTAESVLIPQKLQQFGLSKTDAISILGILNGMAMPLIMFPSSLLTALATATMPVISESHELKQHYRIQRTIKQTMFITAVIASGTTGLFLAYPSEIGYLIYSQRQMGDILKILALVCPFLYVQVTISGILNGLGEQVFIFKVNMITSVINLLVIFFVIPMYGIYSFILSWILSAAVATFMTASRLKESVKLKLHIFKSFSMPVISMISAYILTKPVINHILIGNERIKICIFIVITGLLYLIILKIFHLKYQR